MVDDWWSILRSDEYNSIRSGWSYCTFHSIPFHCDALATGRSTMTLTSTCYGTSFFGQCIFRGGGFTTNFLHLGGTSLAQPTAIFKLFFSCIVGKVIELVPFFLHTECFCGGWFWCWCWCWGWGWGSFGCWRRCCNRMDIAPRGSRWWGVTWTNYTSNPIDLVNCMSGSGSGSECKCTRMQRAFKKYRIRVVQCSVVQFQKICNLFTTEKPKTLWLEGNKLISTYLSRYTRVYSRKFGSCTTYLTKLILKVREIFC